MLKFTGLPSVLWRCWLGGRKGIRLVVVGCWRGYLSGQDADLYMFSWCHCHSVSRCGKSRLVFTSLFYLSGTSSPA